MYSSESNIYILLMVRHILLRGTLAHRTYSTHKNLPGIYLPIFTIKNKIWFDLVFTMVPRILHIQVQICTTLSLYIRTSCVLISNQNTP